MVVLGICKVLDAISVIRMKNGRYSIFQTPNGVDEIQFLIENTTVTVFIQIFDYGMTVIFNKINGHLKPRKPPPHMWGGGQSAHLILVSHITSS